MAVAGRFQAADVAGRRAAGQCAWRRAVRGDRQTRRIPFRSARRSPDGLEDAEYVELSALVRAVTVADTFYAALELPQRALGEPEPGEPTRMRSYLFMSDSLHSGSPGGPLAGTVMS